MNKLPLHTEKMAFLFISNKDTIEFKPICVLGEKYFKMIPQSH